MIFANTELVKFITMNRDNINIPLTDVEVYDLKKDSTYSFSGTFKITKENVRTTITRISNGDVSILVESITNPIYDKSSLGSFYSKEDVFQYDAFGSFEFYIDNFKEKAENGETIILPIAGNIEIGRTSKYEFYGNSTAILRSGEVIILGKTIMGKPYKSNLYELNVGDKFHLEKQFGIARGILTINEKSAMQVAYRVVGEKGRIINPGEIGDVKTGYYLSRSLFSRFENDPLVKSISLALAILISIAEVGPLFSCFTNKKKNKSKKKKSK